MKKVIIGTSVCLGISLFVVNSWADRDRAISVTVDGQTYSCNGDGQRSGRNRIDSAVDVACIKQNRDRYYSVPFDLAKKWANEDCRTTVSSSCREISQQPNTECANMIIGWWYSLGSDSISQINEACKTRTYICE